MSQDKPLKINTLEEAEILTGIARERLVKIEFTVLNILKRSGKKMQKK